MAAGASQIRAGGAFVEATLRDASLQKSLRALEGRFKAFGGAIQGIGTRLAALGAAATTPFLGAIKIAGDMAETQSKLAATFGDSTEAVREWGNAYAKEVGRSEKQMADFAANTGAVLKGFGFGEQQAARMSQTVSALAVDLGSFFNTTDDEALRALISGLTGESEPLKKFGLVVQDTQTKMELLQKGINPESATQQQKAMARLNLILKGTTDAQGDAIRTAGSFNNQMKAVRGSLTDLAVEAGQALLPTVTALVSSVRSFLTPLAEWVKKNQGLTMILAKVALGVAAAGAAILGLSVAASAVASVFSAIGAALGVLLSPLGLVTAGIVAAGYAFFTFSETGREALDTLKTDALAAFQGIADALKAGDIALAGQILWATLKIEWQKGVNFLNRVWADWGVAFLKVFSDVRFAIAGGMLEVIGTLRKAFLDLTGVADEAFSLIKIGVLELKGDTDAALAESFAFSRRSDERTRDRKRIDRETGAQQEALADQQEAADAARIAAANKAVTTGEGRLATLQQELQALTGKAAGEAGGAESARKRPEISDLFTPEGVDQAVTRAAGKVEATGGFGAGALAGLGFGSSIENDQLKEQKKIAKEMQKLNDKADQSKLLFQT